VIREVTALAGRGCQEVVLAGIHLSSYGVDLDTSLLELIRSVHEIEGIRRIRLGSLEPGIITEEFAASLAAMPKVCPHFHLSLQSGCTATLKRMNRRYTAEEFEEKCRILREAFDRPAITTDVIVGFPGETEEEFAATEAFLERIRLYETHIFKYSRRHGTRAAMMPDQVPEQIKTERSERLIALGDRNRSLFEESRRGSSAEVLFEEKTEIDGRSYYTGYTKEYIRTVIPADADYDNICMTGSLGEAIDHHIFLLNTEERQ
jgi:threonylcarbamoyladenosine tRNA methylthiotransferase MtaB